MRVYLASASPRRQELLAQIGIAFQRLPQNIDESIQADEAPRVYASRLALEKARAGWASALRTDNLPVLGADTIVVINNIILGKPKDKADALRMLALLSGKTHEVITAIAVVQGEHVVSACSISRVTFSEVTSLMAEAYWESGEPVDKAGAYAIQGGAARFITNIEGSYSGIMGLPLYEVNRALSEMMTKSNLL